MNTIQSVAQNVMRTIQQNSPAILTALGITGVATTAYLAHNAAVKSTIWAAERVSEREPDADVDPKQEMKALVQENWKHYIPTFLSGAAAIACIVGAHTVHSRRQAALISAYTLAERALTEYREKVREEVGAKTEEKIRDEVNKERLKGNPPTEGNTIVIAGKDSLFFDAHSGRYFHSDMETIRRAENDINFKINNHMYASLNEFWSMIGVPSLPMGENMGWNTDQPLELRFTTMYAEDGRPCGVVEFRKPPLMDYYSLH